MGKNALSFYYLAKCLNKNINLEKLQISENKIKPLKKTSIQYLDLMETVPKISLKCLELYNNSINLDLLNRILINNNTLEDLNLSHLESSFNNFKDFRMFCEFLGENKSLLNLDLSFNEI